MAWTRLFLRNYLIFIKLAIFVRRFSLLLEGNDNKTNKDIDHKEGNDDNINEIENSHNGSIIVDRSNILSIGIDRYV